MSTAIPPAQTGASQQAVIDAALVLLQRMGLSTADLAVVPQDRPPVPTFAEYIPAVAATISARTRLAAQYLGWVGGPDDAGVEGVGRVPAGAGDGARLTDVAVPISHPQYWSK
jgi:hypothetical protein